MIAGSHAILSVNSFWPYYQLSVWTAVDHIELKLIDRNIEMPGQFILEFRIACRYMEVENAFVETVGFSLKSDVDHDIHL